MTYNLITNEFLDKLDKVLNPEIRIRLTEHDTTVLMHNVHQLFVDNNIAPCITELYLLDIERKLRDMERKLHMQLISRGLKQ